MVKQFDIKMQVKLCEPHKKVFEETVKRKLANVEMVINPSKLVVLWKEAEECSECEWKTTFGKEAK